MDESDFPSAQGRCATGTCDVLAAPWREPQDAVHTDDEGERFRQLVLAARCQPAREVIRRVDHPPFATGLHRCEHLRGTHAAVILQPFCHLTNLDHPGDAAEARQARRILPGRWRRGADLTGVLRTTPASRASQYITGPALSSG